MPRFTQPLKLFWPWYSVTPGRVSSLQQTCSIGPDAAAVHSSASPIHGATPNNTHGFRISVESIQIKKAEKRACSSILRLHLTSEVIDGLCDFQESWFTIPKFEELTQHYSGCLWRTCRARGRCTSPPSWPPCPSSCTSRRGRDSGKWMYDEMNNE